MKVKFLGTAGARYVMATQLRSSAGIYLEEGGKKMVLDPGPGTLVRMAKSRPRLAPSKLDAVILSHIHLDHSGDVNALLDAVTEGAKRKRGVLLAPSEAVEGEDRVVFRYLLGAVEVLRMEPEGVHEIGGVKVETSCPHRHGVETYGIKIPFEGGKMCFLVDTAFFEDLKSCYSDCTHLVVNTVLRECNPKIKHLCVENVEALALSLRPELLIMTHFGMGMLRAKPWEVAEELSARTGVEIRAAYDGFTLNFDRVMENP